jgi:hypothetical protein
LRVPEIEGFVVAGSIMGGAERFGLGPGFERGGTQSSLADPQVPEAARIYCPLSRNSANLTNRSNHST